MDSQSTTTAFVGLPSTSPCSCCLHLNGFFKSHQLTIGYTDLSTDSLKKCLEFEGRGFCIQNVMGDLVQGDFVRGILSKGDFVQGHFVRGVVRGDFVLEHENYIAPLFQSSLTLTNNENNHTSSIKITLLTGSSCIAAVRT